MDVDVLYNAHDFINRVTHLFGEGPEAAGGAVTGRRSASSRRRPYRAIRLGRLVVTTCVQGTTRSIVDRAWTHDDDGNVYESVAVIFRPWRRNEYGEYLRQRALVVGWRKP